MVVSAQEYWSKLYRIQDQNPPSLALLLPSTERTYHIDLSSRTVESPKFLSVAKDHQAEVIYFTVNRFFDYMDLSTTVCIVQYINAAGESWYYPVPFYDIYTPNQDKNLGEDGTPIVDSELMMFPWCISGAATKAAGEIKYSFNFYKYDKDGLNLVYSLSTKPASTMILHGMEDKGFDPEEYDFGIDQYKELVNIINENKEEWAGGLKWIKV